MIAAIIIIVIVVMVIAVVINVSMLRLFDGCMVVWTKACVAATGHQVDGCVCLSAG